MSASADIGFRWDFAQIVNSTHAREVAPLDTTWLNGFWIQSIKSVLSVRGKAGERLSVNLRCFGVVQFTLPTEADKRVQERVGGGGVDEVSATVRFARADSLSPALTFGYFPFEYTHPWQRLGAYLFRTGVYPGYILSPQVENRLTGLEFSARLPAPVEHRFFATVDSAQLPANDISFTYRGQVAAGPLEVGAAVMLHRLVRTDQGSFAYSQDVPWQYYRDYPRAGIKIDARASVDLKRLLRSPRLGANDLIGYAEAALLGAANRGGFYDRLRERVPVMGGLTLPTFGLLDVAGVELEWYGSRWKNNPGSLPVPRESFVPNRERNGFAFVDDPSHESAGTKAYTDNVKWAVFFEKSIGASLAISLHAASDHLRPPQGNWVQQEELLHGPTEWYWQVTVRSRF